MSIVRLSVIFLSAALLSPAAKPLQIFILAGQSNMEGHAKVETFGHLGLDPVTVPVLEKMRDSSGDPVVCDEVWISYFNGKEAEADDTQGKLTAGYGSRKNILDDGGKIGPEFTFGIYAQELLEAPVLLIKTAWGGKSLHTDFRPPSAGEYAFDESHLAKLKERGKEVDVIQREKLEATGHYYELMMGYVERVLSDLPSVYPDYDSEVGHELAGFVWFQGWNDMVDSNTYPRRDQEGGYDQYTEVFRHFIRDVRSDLGTPELPFVIGVMGVGGPVDETTEPRYRVSRQSFRDAMAVPASEPEFEGKVAAVLTEEYWDAELGELVKRNEQVKSKARELGKDDSLSREEREAAVEVFRGEIFSDEELELMELGISNAAYHYLGSAKIMAQIGKAFAEAVVSLK